MTGTTPRQNIDLYQSSPNESKTFEISLIVYDSKGNPTNKRKVHSSDYADSISSFWYKNRGKKHYNKKTRQSGGGATTAEDAKKILEGMYQTKETEEKS